MYHMVCEFNQSCVLKYFLELVFSNFVIVIYSYYYSLVLSYFIFAYFFSFFLINESRVCRKQLLYIYWIGVMTAYILHFQTPPLWDFTEYVVRIKELLLALYLASDRGEDCVNPTFSRPYFCGISLGLLLYSKNNN